MPEIVLPVIHINGDRRDTLVLQLREAYVALRGAQLALQQTRPNPRNYYPVEGRWEAALAQYEARHAALATIIDSLVAEAKALQLRGKDTHGND